MIANIGALEPRQKVKLLEARAAAADGATTVENILVTALLEVHESADDIRQPANVAELLQDVCARYSYWAEHVGVRIRLELDCHNALAAIESFHLRLVLMNLVRNALQASPLGSTIDLKAERRGTELWIEVMDEGSGIPADVLLSIEGRLQKGRAGLREDQIRLGIGLAVCRDALVMYGARLEASNLSKGGARISVICNELGKD